MIKYTLICEHAHEFDIWFLQSSDYDDQKQRGLVECPVCASRQIEKTIMSPHVQTSQQKAKIKQDNNRLLTIADKIRTNIEQNCEYVGNRFSQEARAMHYGQKPTRGIYGQASNAEAQALSEEGIKAVSIPDIFAPKPKQTLN